MAGIGRSPTSSTAARAKARAAEGHLIINLAHGETFFPTPPHVCAAAVDAIACGQTRYTPAGGTPELRRAVARRYIARGQPVDPGEVIIAAGAKQVLYNALQVTVEAGDEVLLAAPCWVSYPAMVALAGARPVHVQGGSAHKLGAGALAEAIRPNTRWLVLNSPGNPSGAVYTADELRVLADVLADHPHVHVISDEIYEDLAYTRRPAALLEVAPELRCRTLVVSGVSKSYAMTGWRVGFGVGPRKLIDAMEALQSHSTSNPCSVSQAAALAAIEGPQTLVVERRDVLARARDQVVAGLAGAVGLSCARPDGAFYAFPRWDALAGRRSPGGPLLHTDSDFTEALLEEAGVAVVPGDPFGGPGHFRLTFAAEEALLDEALRRIRRFAAALSEADGAA